MADETPQKGAPSSKAQQNGTPSSNANDGQFVFLIACIRHSENGKVDFTKVAEECSIVSKGAAAKRYERLMKAHGLHSSQISGGSPRTPSGGKKRKNDQTHDQGGDDGDGDDVFAAAKPKAKKPAVKRQSAVKEEDPGKQLLSEQDSV